MDAPRRPNTIDPKFMIERQGKPMVLYAGLLDLAHSQGLRAIRTRLIQVPADDNNLTAIVSAEVETDRGTFSGIGDANPSNVGRMILTATIRMAETRAKARALRDACNIGMVSFEEIGPDDPDDHHAPPAPRPTPPPPAPRERDPREGPPVGAPIMGQPATEAQTRAVFAIGTKRGLSREEILGHAMAMFHTTVDEMSRKQASDYITRLNDDRPLPALPGRTAPAERDDELPF